MAWYVNRLTDSLFLVVFWGFLSQISPILINPFAGVWANRGNRHHLLITTKILAFFQASVLAILVLIRIVITEVLIPYVHSGRRSINLSLLSGFKG